MSSAQYFPASSEKQHRKGYNSRIKISVFRVSNWSRSLVILSWDREARISLSWCARAFVLLRRGMNLAAQDTLFPLCTTRFTKLKQPLRKIKGQPCSDLVQSLLHSRHRPFHVPAFDSSLLLRAQILQQEKLIFLYVRCYCPLLVVSKTKQKVRIKGKAVSGDTALCWQRLLLLDPLDRQMGLGHTSLWACDAKISEEPYLWLVFFLVGATWTFGLSGPSHLLSESSRNCFQHPHNGETSHLCQYFHLFRLFHSWIHLCLWFHMLSSSGGQLGILH